VADTGGASYALQEKTRQLTMLGDLGRAQETVQRSLELAQKNGDQQMIVGDMTYLGNIAKLEGQLDEARKVFSQALSKSREQGIAAISAEDEISLAEVAEEQNDRQEARKQIDTALASLHEHKDPGDEVDARVLLARLYLAQGDTMAANHAMEDALAVLYQVPEDREAHFIFAITQGRVQAAMGKLSQARESLKGVIAETGKYKFLRYQLEARLAMCEVEAKADPAAARVRAQALAHEAQSKGFGLIAHKALAVGA